MIVYLPLRQNNGVNQAPKHRSCSFWLKSAIIAILLTGSITYIYSEYQKQNGKSVTAINGLTELAQFQHEESEVEESEFIEENFEHLTEEMQTRLEGVKNGTLGLMPAWDRVSEQFYIKHDPSNMYVIPPQPPYDTLTDGFYHQVKMTNTKNSSSLWRFVPMQDFPSWGLIQNVDSKKYMTVNKYRSRRGYLSRLQVQSDFNYQSLFTFRQTQGKIGYIAYKNAKFQPYAQRIQPEEGNPVAVGTATFDVQHRYSGRDDKNKLANVHDTGVVGGYWTNVLMNLNPLSTYEETYIQKEGFQETNEMKNDRTLTQEAGFSFVGISTKISYKTTFGQFSSSSFYNQTTTTQTFKIFQGVPVCIYQFNLLGQFDSYKMPLATNIHADTDCEEDPPNIYQD